MQRLATLRQGSIQLGIGGSPPTPITLCVPHTDPPFDKDPHMRVFETLLGAALLMLALEPHAAAAQIRRMPSSAGIPRRASADVETADPRSLLGMTLASSGTERDTLGLLVTQTFPDGPAERAGIDEGSRIGDIDGVSLRLDPSDIGRASANDAAARRLTRTLHGLRDGERATLRVFGGGRYRTVMVQLGGAANGAVAAATPAPLVASPAGVTVVEEPTARFTTVESAIRAIGDLQSQLRRLADDQGNGVLADSLAQSARDLAQIQRRLHAADADQRRRLEDLSDNRPALRRAGGDVPGLSLSPVTDDLSDYFGEGSERGLLVLQAESAWDPIRPGDVILSIDGAPASIDRLRDVADSRRPVRVELLRRRRHTSVTLRGREER